MRFTDLIIKANITDPIRVTVTIIKRLITKFKQYVSVFHQVINGQHVVSLFHGLVKVVPFGGGERQVDIA